MTKMNYAKDKIRKKLGQNLVQAPFMPHLDVKEFKRKMTSIMPPPAPVAAPAATPPVSYPGITTQVMTVTPDMAYKWLDGATHNRPLRHLEVMKMSYDMGHDRWKLNGESVIFDWNGVLVDGQHRLYACIESNMPFETVVVTGVDPSTFTTIDQGKHRSPTDHLHAAQITAPPNTMKFVAAAAGLVFKYRSNSLFLNLKINPDHLIEMVKTEPALIDWVARSRKSPTGLKGFGSSIAACLHVGSETRPDEASRFMDDWITGANLAAGNPVLTLRARVMNKPPIIQWERLLIVVSAWNAYVNNRSLLKIGSLRGDRFPPIIGENNDS